MLFGTKFLKGVSSGDFPYRQTNSQFFDLYDTL